MAPVVAGVKAGQSVLSHVSISESPQAVTVISKICIGKVHLVIQIWRINPLGRFE